MFYSHHFFTTRHSSHINCKQIFVSSLVKCENKFVHVCVRAEDINSYDESNRITFRSSINLKHAKRICAIGRERMNMRFHRSIWWFKFLTFFSSSSSYSSYYCTYHFISYRIHKMPWRWGNKYERSRSKQEKKCLISHYVHCNIFIPLFHLSQHFDTKMSTNMMMMMMNMRWCVEIKKNNIVIFCIIGKVIKYWKNVCT
jgi:hypothetical protein